MKHLYIICVAATLTMAGCKSQKKSEPAAPPTVQTITVAEAQGQTDRTYVGTVKEGYGSSLSFATAGTVSRVMADEGQAVSKGQTLATLDETQARNAHSMAKAALAQAEDAFRRMDILYRKGSLPEIRYIDVKTKLAEARASEQMARKALADCVLRAPFSGYVARRTADAGQNVVPGLECFQLVKINPVNVTIPVPEQEMAEIRTGQTVAFTVAALGNRRYAGVVAKKGVQANAISHTYDVTLSVSNADGQLLPGMVCSVEARSQADLNMVVPQEAVLTDGHNQYVWIVAGDTAVRRTVSVDGVSAGGVMVSDGLRPGDRVIVAGQNKVSQGMKVKF